MSDGALMQTVQLACVRACVRQSFRLILATVFECTQR